jgi:hypothetical protein
VNEDGETEARTKASECMSCRLCTSCVHSFIVWSTVPGRRYPGHQRSLMILAFRGPGWLSDEASINRVVVFYFADARRKM